jgi:hypothetical protein
MVRKVVPAVNTSVSYDSPRHKPDYRLSTANQDLDRSLKHKLKQVDVALGVLALLGIVFAAYSEHYFFSNNYTSDSVVHSLRTLVSLLTVSSIVLLISRSFILLKHKKATAQCEDEDTLWSVGLYKQMALEICLTAVHCPPGLDYTFEVNIMRFTVVYSLDTFLTFFVLLRAYLALRVLLHFSEYTTTRARWVLRAFNLDVSTSFTLKAYIYSRPMITVSLVFIVCSVFWAELLLLSEKPERITEEGCTDGSPCTEESALHEFSNCFWLTFVTTSTVGYGEIYPYTHVGRAVAMLACILGNVYTGLLVLALQSNLDVSDVQQRVMTYTFIRNNHSRMYSSAVTSVRQFLKLRTLHKSFKDKYAQVSLLKSYKITNYEDTSKRSVLLPLTKVYGRRLHQANDILVLDRFDYWKKKLEVTKLRHHLGIIKECSRKVTAVSSGQTVTMMGEGWDIDLMHLAKYGRSFTQCQQTLKPLVNWGHEIKSKAVKLKTLTGLLSNSLEGLDITKFHKLMRPRVRRQNLLNVQPAQDSNDAKAVLVEHGVDLLFTH